jgi:hypothetical protein
MHCISQKPGKSGYCVVWKKFSTDFMELIIGTLTSQENGSTKIIVVFGLYLFCYLFNVLKLSSNPLSSHPAVE